MRLPSTSGRGSSGPNMTPMIDVVFLLIIFFLVSSHLAKQEKQTPLDLPVASIHEPPPAVDERLVLNVHANQTLSVRGKPIDTDQLRQLLQSQIESQGDQAKLHIRCDQGTPYTTIEPILRDASRVNLQQITFAVVTEP